MTVEEQIPQQLRRRLYLPAYTITEAARYAGTKPGTISSWHYRAGRLGPVLPGKEARKPLSYLQLVEVAFVADLRSIGISMQRIRKARDYLMKRFDAEYPFAQLKVRNAGPHVVMDLLEVEPDSELGNLIIADAHGQLGWSDVIEDRFLQFDYIDDVAIRWNVVADSPVVIDARIAFGAPQIKGVPTWTLKGRQQAGESVDEIAEDFGLTLEDVKAALTFEGVPLAA